MLKAPNIPFHAMHARRSLCRLRTAKINLVSDLGLKFKRLRRFLHPSLGLPHCCLVLIFRNGRDSSICIPQCGDRRISRCRLSNRHRLIDKLFRLPHQLSFRSSRTALQISAKTKHADHEAYSDDDTRNKVVSFEFRLANLTKPAAGKNSPIGTIYLFSAICTKAWPKEHPLHHPELSALNRINENADGSTAPIMV